MKKALFLLFTITLFWTGSVFAQLINIGTYRFNGANSITAITPPANLIGAGADNAVSPVTDIGFDFWFAGTKYTKFSVTEDGLMKLGNLGDPAIISEPVNNMASGTNLPKIAPYWDDLATGTGGYVGYQLAGTTPNRILRIKWFVAIPKTNAAANAMFQAELYENGSIHFAFGATYPPVNNAGYSMGIGVSATDWASVTVTGTTFATAAYGGYSNNSNTMTPGNGSVKRYQFSSDYTAPSFPTISSIPNSFGTQNRTTTVRITDLTPATGTGVPLTGSLVPRIYYKRTTDASWVSTAGVNQTGTSTDGTWLFTVDHSLLVGGAANPGDQIQYFIVAQDQSVAMGHPNISSNTSAGFTATDVNTILTPPTTPLSYLIGSDFSGVKTVGTGGDYPSLTLAGGIFEQINAGQLSSNLTVKIISNLTGETGTNSLNAWANGAGGPYSITIQPDGGARSITGYGLIKLNGTQGLIIDGLNDGTNSLTIDNTSGTAISLTGASNTTITRTTIKGSGSSGGGVIVFTNSTTPCSNNTISYCTITSSNPLSPSYHGILYTGNASTGTGNIIDNNIMTNFSYYAIHKGYITTSLYTNFTISNNEIYNTVAASERNYYQGICLESTSGTSSIFNNKIHDLLVTFNTSPGSGISAIVTTNTASDVTNIYNNVIYLDATVNNPLQSWTGIYANNGGTSYVDYNSIYIGGSGTNTSFARGIYKSATTGTSFVRNNVAYISRTGSVNTAFSIAGAATQSNNYSGDPGFTSPTNLLPDVTNPFAANLDGLGTPIASITTDILGITRNAGTPDIGAYEFELPCSNPTSGGVITAVASICAGQTPANLVATAASGQTGTLEYQWQSSTDNVTFTNITAATSADYQPVALTVNTYFKRLARVDCKINWVSATESNVVLITVNPLPVVTTANTAVICSGTNPAIALSATVASTFTWTVGTVTGVTGASASNGNSTTIDQVLTNSGTVPGTVQYIVIPTSVTGTCAGAAYPITVTVNPITPVSVFIFGSNNNNPVCQGASVTFYAIPNGGTTPIYVWKVNGGIVGTNAISYSYIPANGDVVTCELTPDATIICPSTNTAISNQLNMVVSSNLVPTVSISTSGNQVCSGSSLSFTATPINGGLAPTYQWKVNNVNAGTNSPVFTYTSPNTLVSATDIVKCEMISNAPCALVTPVTSNAVSISVIPLLQASVAIVADANPVCDGTTVTFTATPTNGGTAPTYQWYNGATAVGTGGTTFSYIPANGDVVSVVMTSNATPCLAGSPATSNAITVTFFPRPQLETTINGVIVTDNHDGVDDTGVFEVCNSSASNLTLQFADLMALTPTTSIKVEQQFTRTNVVFSPINLIAQIKFFTTPFNLNVKLINAALPGTLVMRFRTFMDRNNNNVLDANECAGDWIVYTVTINPLLPASVSIAASANPVSAGTPVTFTPAPFNGGTAPTYEWFVNTAPVATTNTYSYTPNAGDQVYVVLTSNSACATVATATSPALTMTILSNVTATLNAAGPFCVYDAPVQLIGLPAGGIYSGTGVSATGLFTPATVGNQVITYTYTDLTGSMANASTTITVNPRPQLRATINGLIVTDNHDGVDDTGAFEVCNSTANNILFTPFEDLIGVAPSSSVKVIQQFIKTNVNFSPYNRILPLSIYKTFSERAYLINAALPGTLEMRFSTFMDGNNNNVLDNNECAGDWIVYTVTVNPLLPASVSIAASINPVSAGTPVTFTPAPFNGGTAPTYEWFVNSASVATGATYSYTPNAGDQVYVVMTSSSACATVATATSPMLTMTILSNVIATLNAAGPFCVYDAPVQLIGLPAGGIYSGTGISATGLFTPATVGNEVITYTYTDLNGGMASASTTITVNPRPQLEATINGLTVKDNHDGVDDLGAIEVCNSSISNLTLQFVDLMALTPTTSIKVQQQYTRTNVIFSPIDLIAQIKYFTTQFNLNVKLINAALPGTLVMKFRTFLDGNNNNLLDNNECAGDWIVYTVTVNSGIPADAGAITGDINPLLSSFAIPYSVSPIANATSYVWTYSGSGVTINSPVGPLGYAVTLDFAADASPGTLNVMGQNACGNGTVGMLNLTPVLLKSAKITTGLDGAGDATTQLSAYAFRNIEIRISGNVSRGALATLYDIQGRVVRTQLLEEGSLNSMPTPGIKSAIYLLSVNDHGKVQTFKIPVNE